MPQLEWMLGGTSTWVFGFWAVNASPTAFRTHPERRASSFAASLGTSGGLMMVRGYVNWWRDWTWSFAETSLGVLPMCPSPGLPALVAMDLVLHMGEGLV